MKFLQKISAVWILRISLGISYVYSGYDLFVNPKGWIWAVPQWFSQLLTNAGISVDTYLQLQGISELLLAVLFFAWFLGKWGLRIAAAVSAIEIAAILIFVGIDLVTFRDIPILGASLALFIISFRE